ncbi:MAG: DUF4232 domain-containing protein [Actinomycetota bacterium]|nr:DUF4232 domain-containing protein [Actinomycetota bacterium]
MNVLSTSFLVLLVGTGVAYGLKSITRDTGVTTQPTPSASFVPWSDATPGPEETQPSTPQAPAGTRPCAKSDLVAAYGFGNGATGHLDNVFNFANRSESLCALQGVPSVRLIDARGDVIPAQQETGSWFPDNGNERVAVQPGVRLPGGEDTPRPGIAVLQMEWTDCSQARVVDSVDVALPGDGGTMRIKTGRGGLGRSNQAMCDGNPSPGPGRLGVNHFKSVDPAPPAYSNLAVAARVPEVVRAGERFRYEITLTNEGTTDVVFDPCPTHVENLSDFTYRPAPFRDDTPVPAERLKNLRGMSPHLLNCVAAPSIPARSSLTFEMFFDVPAATPAGQARLHWDLVGGTALKRAPKGILITIVR